MAATLSIIKSPPTIGLVEEGLKYEIERVYASSTGIASLQIFFPNDDTLYLDKFFEIEAMNEILKFYFRTTPNETGFEINTWNIGTTVYSFFLAFVSEEMSANYYINKNYVVTTYASGILLTAKNPGTYYNLALGTTDVTGMIEGTNTAGIDDAIEDDYRVYVAVVLKSGADPMAVAPLGEDYSPVDADLIAYADVAEYLKSQLSSSFHFPFAGTIVYAVADAVIPYFIRFSEYKEFVFHILYHDFLTAHYAIAGGLKMLDSDFLTGQTTDLFTSQAKHWLTWAPAIKTTYPDVSEKLYFLLTSANCVLKKKAWYSATDVTTTVQTITQAAYSVVELFVGVPELFANEDVSDLRRYEVWVETSGGAILDNIRVFEVDHNFYLNKRTILFKNSFDMYDLLHCTGDLSVSESIKREEMEVLSNNAFRRRIELAENSSPYKLNTGWLNKETRRWLEELQLSKTAYLALGDVLLPIVLTTTKAEREVDREHNYSLALTFEPDFANSRYSDLIGNDGIQFLTDDQGVIYTDDNLDQYFN